MLPESGDGGSSVVGDDTVVSIVGREWNVAGLTELAAVMMDAAQRRIDVTAGNIGNLNTPGFRAKRVFQHVLDDRLATPVTSTGEAAQGQPALKATGNPLDIAATGGAIVLRIGDSLVSASSAQLRRGEDGQLIAAAGGVLQAAGGGDVIVGRGVLAILRDGTVLIDGQPEARIGLFAAGEARGGILPDPAEDGVLHQGMLTASNVDLAAEMIDLTQAGRMAEAGAKLFQIGDELLGKVASTVGDMRR